MKGMCRALPLKKRGCPSKQENLKKKRKKGVWGLVALKRNTGRNRCRGGLTNLEVCFEGTIRSPKKPRKDKRGYRRVRGEKVVLANGKKAAGKPEGPYRTKNRQLAEGGKSK